MGKATGTSHLCGLGAGREEDMCSLFLILRWTLITISVVLNSYWCFCEKLMEFINTFGDFYYLFFYPEASSYLN